MKQRGASVSNHHRQLRKEIALILAVKLLAIVVLWQLFVSHRQVDVDSAAAGSSVLGEISPATSLSTGSPHDQ
ncbi:MULTISPECIES: cytochrome oxidase putative small subunit CydP [Hydrocarboniphaga]|jgi:hypothetical protein|nr:MULTISPECIES: cytochrome oxidase putative small subunit CydP [Hydrocarboniphaga]MDZ4077953.1 hypothetical protein [Hydrocarboniphaga sp.]